MKPTGRSGGLRGNSGPRISQRVVSGLFINVFAPLLKLLGFCLCAAPLRCLKPRPRPQTDPRPTHTPQDLLQSQHHARLLAEALTHFISSATNGSLTGVIRAGAPSALVSRAAGLLRAAAAAAPIALLSLDCLPQLQAAAAWDLPQAGVASGGCSSSRGGDSGCAVGAALPPPALEAVERLLSRSAALAASVGARVLSFSDAEALREIERAMAAGDAEAASQQLLKCTGGLGGGGGGRGRAGAAISSSFGCRASRSGTVFVRGGVCILNIFIHTFLRQCSPAWAQPLPPPPARCTHLSLLSPGRRGHAQGIPGSAPGL